MKNSLYILMFFSMSATISAESPYNRVKCLGTGCPRPNEEGRDTSRGYQIARGWPSLEKGNDPDQYPSQRQYNSSRGYPTESGYYELSKYPESKKSEQFTSKNDPSHH